jgi:uncharacterized protein (DUF111 family)
VTPEYDDCKRVAQSHGLPLRQVYQQVLKLASDSLV